MTELQRVQDLCDDLGIPYELQYRPFNLAGHWTITVGSTRLLFEEKTGRLLGLLSEGDDDEYVAMRREILRAS